MKSFAIALVLGLVALASDVQAGPRRCGHCGCPKKCKKVCRLVCGTKTETKTVYSCECKDFCVPGPSHKCGVKCEYDECGHKCRHTIWKPTCAHVRTRAKLVKKEVSKEVPDYTWEVEEVCCGCGHCLSRTEQADAPAQASLADDSEARPASATEAISDDAEIAVASEREAVEPAVDEAQPAGLESPRAEPRRPSRILRVLSGVN